MKPACSHRATPAAPHLPAPHSPAPPEPSKGPTLSTVKCTHGATSAVTQKSGGRCHPTCLQHAGRVGARQAGKGSTCVLGADEGHLVGVGLQADEATLPVHGLVGVRMEGVEPGRVMRQVKPRYPVPTRAHARLCGPPPPHLASIPPTEREALPGNTVTCEGRHAETRETTGVGTPAPPSLLPTRPPTKAFSAPAPHTLLSLSPPPTK